jgi:hypothetical protein
MSITSSEMTPADIAAVTNNRGNGGFGDGFGDGWWIILLFLFGFGGRGFGGGFGGGYGGECATQADVRAAVDQQTLISKIDQQTYGLADSFTALNNTLNNNFRGLDNAICTLGYQGAQHANNLSAQLAQCCCDTRAAIKDNTTQGVMNTNAIQQQIAACCCDIEKANMQNRFDAQAYNCNTLQAIDKLGDRIIDYMAAEKTQALRDENQALRLAASQAKQNQYLINELRPCPIPAYITCNPYAANYGNCGCGGNF